MSRGAHFTYLSVFVAIILIVTITGAYYGSSYYMVSLEDRFYHPDNKSLKPSGYIGHSLGIMGSVFIISGVGLYMARKRYRFLHRLGNLMYWLEFHIFMCILGTIMVVFHTTFKLGGVAGISFWSMVTALVSGVAGRFIYLQIPRTIEGRELDLKEVREIRNDILSEIRDSYNMDEETFKYISFSIEKRSVIYIENRHPRFLKKSRDDRKTIHKINSFLRQIKLSRSKRSQIMVLVKNDIRLERILERLERMKNLFRYWHVFHFPFTIVMLIFLIIHVIIIATLGYAWNY
jgi:hypothetical protein